MMTRDYAKLYIRQQPLRAQVVQESNPKNRKPVDPPPIVELKYEGGREHGIDDQWLVSPRTFMMVTLIDAEKPDENTSGKQLIGQTVSSLHRLKDPNNKGVADGGFFVFGDISAKKIGSYKLRFSLFDRHKEDDQVCFVSSIDSESFSVLAQREFGSMSESSTLTRTFSDQGVKLRVRKDARQLSGVGTKRPYNASPVESSPPMHQAMYGGAVQDQHYGTTTPELKRQRADSDFAQSNIYQNMSLSESNMTHYSSTIPSSTRQWADSDHHGRGHANYGQHSPLLVPTMQGRTMNLATNTWMPQPLPSPSPSVSNHTPTYPTVSSQQQTSPIYRGEPGLNNSVPRNYFHTAYSFAPQTTQYEGHHLGEDPSSYPEPPLTAATIADSTGLGSTHSYGHNAHYLSGHMFSSEPTDHAATTYAAPFLGGTPHQKNY